MFRKPVIAKMLVDSGNLVNDLISAEFADLIKVRYIATQKQKVGTASKNGSVSIIGQCRPFKIFLENLPKPLTIQPFVVKELSHPINVGRNFLGRYKGKLEFSPDHGFLEIKSQKVKLISKTDELLDNAVTDARIRKVMKMPQGHPYSAPDMVKEGMLNSVQDKPFAEIPIFAKSRVEIPAMSGRFVPFSTGGKIPLRIAREQDLVIRPEGREDEVVLVLPGVCRTLQDTAYSLVVNPDARDVVVEEGYLLGHVTTMDRDNGEEDQRNPKPEVHILEKLQDKREFLRGKLKLDENPLIKENPNLGEEILQAFTDNWDAVSKDDFDYGHATAVQCQIQLKPGEETPVKLRARPLNPAQEASMKKQLKEWEAAGVIEKTQSPWAFPMVGVKKKDSDMIRWCVDYRLLNQKTVKDAYPLSSIENNLHKLQGAKYFTTLDSAGAYHNVEIHPESREYTAFITPFGQYQFVRMPFGLSNAGACYGRLMEKALQHLPAEYVMGYLDDIIVSSKTIEEHIEQLRNVLEVHKEFGMKLKLSKCKVLQTQVEYLGHLVSEEGIQMVPSYVKRILEWPLPRTGKQLKQFLGFIGYYRGFIPEVADLTFEMNEMKKDAKLNWKPEAEEKFRILKEKFQEAPLRAYPDYTSPEPFILDTDFSKTNVAAILSQKQNGEEKFIGAAARKCNQAEQNYPSHKGELAAAIMGMRKFEHILRFKPFVLRTDSRCMQFLGSLKEVRGIYARWLNFLQGFDFQVVHRPGAKNQNADALSRMENLGESSGDEEEMEKDQIEDVYNIDMEEIESGLKTDPLGEQKKDPVLKEVIKWVEAKRKPDKEESKNLGTEYLAYRVVFEKLKIVPELGLVYEHPEDRQERFCLPERLFAKAFRMVHSHPSAGHFGISASQRKFRKKFFLPGAGLRIVAAVKNS